MKTALSALIAGGLLGASANAGGPVVVVEDAETVVEGKASSSTGILPLLLIPVAICIFLCGDDENPPPD